MEPITKYIPMKPFPKKRPRVTRRNTYTPNLHLYHQCSMIFGYFPPAPMYKLSVTTVRKMPASWSATKREKMKGLYATPPPDRDNVLGGVMDALFEDDSAVVEAHSSQIWGDDWGMWVTLTPLAEGAKPTT